MLDLAKLRAHRFTVQAEEVDMSRLVEHAYGAFGDEARRREIDYRLLEEGDPPTIITDGDRVLQVITNLLNNAFRWTPDGGVIELEMHAVERRRPRRRRRLRAGDRAGRSRSRSSGRSSPSDTQGTGLGLPIARELAGALGGRIEVESEVGQGEPLPPRASDCDRLEPARVLDPRGQVPSECGAGVTDSPSRRLREHANLTRGPRMTTQAVDRGHDGGRATPAISRGSSCSSSPQPPAHATRCSGQSTRACEAVETIAVWDGHDFIDGFSYDLAGTPCADVVHKGLCVYPHDVIRLFPEDEMFVDARDRELRGDARARRSRGAARDRGGVRHR